MRANHYFEMRIGLEAELHVKEEGLIKLNLELAMMMGGTMGITDMVDSIHQLQEVGYELLRRDDLCSGLSVGFCGSPER